MNDPEFRQLMKKFFITIAIALAFIIPIFFIFCNKLQPKENSILTDINNNKTMLIYITENKCSNCKKISKALNGIKYKELVKENNSYKTIINKLGMKDSNIYTPTLIYVKKGKLYSYIVDIKKEEEINKFIKNNKLK